MAIEGKPAPRSYLLATLDNYVRGRYALRRAPARCNIEPQRRFRADWAAVDGGRREPAWHLEPVPRFIGFSAGGAKRSLPCGVSARSHDEHSAPLALRGRYAQAIDGKPHRHLAARHGCG